MNRIFPVLCLAAVTAGANGQSLSQAGERPFYFLEAKVIHQVKSAYTEGRFNDHPAVKKLFSEARKALDKKPPSIVMSKVLPPSGDPHDYYSMARYWWPDSSKPDGLPYIRHDGRSNPEIRNLPDHRLLDEMVAGVRVLSFAYYLSGDEAYARQAMRYLQTWFLDSATFMNPRLSYAQVVRGRGEGRSYGILDARSLAFIPDALKLLESSPSCTSEKTEGIQKWFAEYVNWLTTSPQGREEAFAKNNHQTWYMVQTLPLADFAENVRVVKKLLSRARTDILKETTADGRQPRELARTNGLGYSMFNITACLHLFTICEALGEDNWNYIAPGGQSLKKCLDFLLPYILQQKKWTYQQIQPYHFAEAFPVYRKAARVYKDDDFRKVARRYSGEQNKSEVENVWNGYLLMK